jgi:hypothetical protein
MLVEDMGGGKTTFVNILEQSNAKYCLRLPTKIYAWDFVENFPQGIFKRKLILHDDLIPAFSGLSEKSKQQLIGFFMEMLDKFKYEQLGKTQEGECNALFGIAKRYFTKRENKELYETTFFDRVTLVKPMPMNLQTKSDVLDLMATRDNPKYPKVKLPLGRKKKIKLDFSKFDLEDIKKLALGFDQKGIMSHTRGFNYILNYMKGNALLNDRKEVRYCDWELFTEVYPIHFSRTDTHSLVRNALIKYKDLSDKDIIEKINIPRRTFYFHKKRLTKE